MKNFNRSLILYLAGVASGIFLVAQLAFRDDEKKKSSEPQVVAAMPYEWKVPKVPANMNFAGEKVPLEKWEVKEAFDRELLYNYYIQQNILYIMKLANRYFPMIEERLKANGIPDDFKYLCVAESNLQNLTSKAGAKGFWQFMPSTGPGYSLEISEDVDERYNMRKSTDAACVYLRNAYNKFGSWTAAAASYNCGMGGYNNYATFQDTKYYYDLMLPEETNRYIFRILTFKHLMSNASALGYKLEESDLYENVATKQIAVTSSISNLSEFAKQHGSNYKMLKILNPWLRTRKLSVKPGKTYYIELPK
jgi:hypothetical protein